MKRIQRDPGLLYSSDDEAVRDGFARLRAADKQGALEHVRSWRRDH